MRAAAIFLLILAAFFVGNAAVSIAYPPYRAYLSGVRSEIFPSVSKEPSKSKEPSNSGEVRVSTSDAVSTGSIQPSVVPSIQPSVVSSVSSSGTALAVALPPEFPLSGILLARLMPEVFPKKIENHGIFDIHIFRDIGFSTYADEKSKTKFYVFAESYGVMLSNLKLVPQAYQIKETDTFFDATFFLNSTDPRNKTTRFVTELEGKAVGIETPNSYYPKLKKFLLQR